jgi:hypothetical protein
MSNIIIKHDIDKIFSCQTDNVYLIPELEKYYVSTGKKEMNVLKDLMYSMVQVYKSCNNGSNSGDTNMKNIIRENLNKINNKNYQDVLNILQGLNYSSGEHYKVLSSELILKSMNDIMAYKSHDSNSNNMKTPSELYVDIIIHFSNFKIMSEGKEVKFKSVFLNLCNEYFTALTNSNEKMDKHNPHRVSNYKGLMNLIGMLFINNIVEDKIIKFCCSKILNLVLYSKLEQDESDNYYLGYERLLNVILCVLEKDKNSNSVLDIFKDFNSKISVSIDVENKYKPLRMSAIILHKQNLKRIGEL